nr:hypothetical protein GCM10010200_091090 [Actinomadura rugatobispora]
MTPPWASPAAANNLSANKTPAIPERQAYLRWRNANARHPDVPAAQRRERAHGPGAAGPVS